MCMEVYKRNLQDICIVIPAYQPGAILSEYIDQLREAGFQHIIVVDDGSGEAHQDIFHEVALKATVLRHYINRGKGAALKTGYSWIRNNLPMTFGTITADSDGQHKTEDCRKLAYNLINGEDALYLGTRNFDLSDIPLKSRVGNKITSIVFKLLYGLYLSDTQTGLRAFRNTNLSFMESISGDRYEYEMNVLIACTKASIPFRSVEIKTVYENNNEGTHFHPVKDSFRIYKVIFGNFIKFMSSSLVSMLVDQGLFNILNLVIFSNGRIKLAKYIFISTIIARIVSAGLNYSLNRKLVFSGVKTRSGSLFRYASLCIMVMLLSAVFTWVLSKVGGLQSAVAKIIIDTLLYFASYHVQQRWVFRGMPQSH